MDKKKILSFIFVFIFLLSLTSSYECKDQTSQWNVPCDLVTPVLSCSTQANVTNINNTAINYNLQMTPVGDGTYNITFTDTRIGTYSIVLCDDSSGSLDVVKGTEENEPEFNIWFLFLIVFFILLIFGTYQENYLLLFLSGCIILIMGVWIFSSNTFSLYSATDYWFVYPLGWIFTGLGILLTVVSGLKMMEESEGGRE